MDWTTRRRAFRAVLDGSKCYHPVSIFDPVSARIAEMLGFEIGIFAGSLGALTVMAAPERAGKDQLLTIITQSEFVEQAYRVCRAGTVPIMVDADDGYGNALNVMRTVEELETAGVALVTIEDTVLPTPYGQKGNRLASLPEMVGKLRAALHARQDPNLLVVARSQAPRHLGTAEIIERARAYEAAGVDGLFFGGIRTREQLEAVSSSVNLPLLLGGASPELMDLDYLASQRVRSCNAGHLPIKAAIAAVYETMKAIRAGVAPGAIPNIASNELLDLVTRSAGFDGWSREFLNAE